MKKIALVLIVLLSISVVGVFAEDEANAPAISSWLFSTVTADADGVDFGPAWGQGDGDLASYLLFGLGYSGEDVGFSGVAVAGSDNFSVNFRNWKVYYEFMDDMFKVSVGKLREGDYRLTDYITHTVNGGGGFMNRIGEGGANGVLLQAMPVDGLSIGVHSDLADATTTATIAWADYANALGFYGSYMIADTAKLVAGFEVGETYGYAGVEVYAVENLKADLVYVYANGANSVGLSAGYALDELNVAVRGDFDIAAAFGWGAGVEVAYNLGDFTPAVYASFDDAGSYLVEANLKVPTEMGQIEVGAGIADGAWYVPVYFQLYF